MLLRMIDVKNLASHFLSLATRQLVGDWQQHYGYKPVLGPSGFQIRKARFTFSCPRFAQNVNDRLADIGRSSAL